MDRSRWVGEGPTPASVRGSRERRGSPATRRLSLRDKTGGHSARRCNRRFRGGQRSRSSGRQTRPRTRLHGSGCRDRKRRSGPCRRLRAIGSPSDLGRLAMRASCRLRGGAPIFHPTSKPEPHRGEVFRRPANPRCCTVRARAGRERRRVHGHRPVHASRLSGGRTSRGRTAAPPRTCSQSRTRRPAQFGADHRARPRHECDTTDATDTPGTAERRRAA